MERLYPGAYVHRLLRTIFHRQPIDASIRHRSAENRPRWSHRRSHRNDKSDGNWEQMWSATPVAGILRASSRAPRSAAAHVRVCHAAVLLDDADRAQRGGQVQRRSVPSASPGFDLAVRAANTRSRQVGSAAETRETPGCSGYRYRRGRPGRPRRGRRHQSSADLGRPGQVRGGPQPARRRGGGGGGDHDEAG